MRPEPGSSNLDPVFLPVWLLCSVAVMGARGYQKGNENYEEKKKHKAKSNSFNVLTYCFYQKVLIFLIVVE